MKKIKKILIFILTILSFFLLGFGLLLFFTALWVRRTWSSLSFSTIIFQLENSLKGTGAGMIPKYLMTAALPAAILFVLILTLYLWIPRRIAATQNSSTPGSPRKTRTLLTLSVILTSLLLSGISIMLLWNRVGLGDYIRYGRRNSYYIEENYADPAGVHITFPEKKRNLIYIYLESMELTYGDTENGGIMPESLIPNLTALASRTQTFAGSSSQPNGALSLYGTDWTMGAMFAETSGLPLIIPIQRNSMFTQDAFFPTVTTLGDILKANGYTNTFLIGSDAGFGGRDLYYTSHGDYQIHDYVYEKDAGNIPDDYMVFWGYEDEKLFQFAREELQQLSRQDSPFNLTLLTVDTHFEDGYTCRLCGDVFDDSYKNAVACSDRQVAAFIAWCETQDFYENTTIIISGDHPTMDKDFNRLVPDDYQRKVYVSVINPAPAGSREDDLMDSQAGGSTETASDRSPRLYSTFDLFPTTLSALGADIPGHRLGLGTDLFSGVPTLLERDGYEEMNTQLKMHSDFMTKLARIEDDSDADFLSRVDELLKDTKITLSLKENEEKGYYRLSASLVTDHPSTMNYMARVYVTVNDGTHSAEFLLEKDDAASLAEGKTIYSADLAMPLSKDSILPEYDRGIFSNEGNHFFSLNEEAEENSPAVLPEHWEGKVTVTLSILTYSEAVISDWTEEFSISY